MSDYGKEPYEKMLRDNPELRATVQLTITLHQNGALSVNGPVSDKALCIALLDNAREALNRQHSKALIVPAHDVGVDIARPL